MVQPVDFSKPVYNSVNINIKKPEVNANGRMTNPIEVNNDNGIYNAVKIDIDNPKVNTQPVYDYPEADGIVTYEMLNLTPVSLPENVASKEITEENSEKETVPAPNYTTLSAEKEENDLESEEEKKTPDLGLSFRGAEIKKPEIIPSEPILPKIDIALVAENLSSESSMDTQAQQIEEIVRTAIVDEETAKHYLVSDIFTNLIDIAQKDVTKLEPPSKKQVEARQKLISNIIAVEKDKNAVNNLPYKMSDEEMALAAELSPMELAERNKEYAVTALSVLAELFIKDFEAKEGRIVPITDAPGISAIVDVLRKDPDPSVKITAIDGLRHIQRPEYKEELSALFTMAQTDPNPNVSKAATISLDMLNNI